MLFIFLPFVVHAERGRRLVVPFRWNKAEAGAVYGLGRGVPESKFDENSAQDDRAHGRGTARVRRL